MARRTSKASVVVYTFGVGGRLVEGADEVYATMARAHRYRNALTEIERTRRQGVRNAQRNLESLVPLHEAMDAAAKRLDDLYAALRANHADQRTRRVSTEQKASIAEAKAELKACAARLREAKTAAEEDLKPKYAELEQAAGAAVRTARATSGVFHSSYQLVEIAAKASRNKLAKKLSEDDDPRFRSFPRPYGSRVNHIANGRIGIIAGGKRVTVADAFSGQSAWLRISPINPSAYYLPWGERRRRTRAQLSFRIGSNPDRSPIWATFSDVQIHRELPADGVITMAWAKLTMRGDRPSDRHWQIQLTVEAPSNDAALPAVHARRGSTAAINLGWRALENGERRIAYVVDDEGDEREITSRNSTVDRFEHVDKLRSNQAKEFDRARDALVAYLSNFKSKSAAIPEPLDVVAEYIHQWRSTSRLAALVRAWGAQRHHGDEHIFGQLQIWLHQDAHLYQWETREHARAQGARQEYYRTVARQLCLAYETIVLGDMDLRVFAAKKRPEDAEADGTAQMRKARARAAPSELVAALKLMAPKFGTRLVKVSAVNITRKCHIHDHTEEWDTRASIEHQWSACGCIHDQDANACHNLLKQFRERSGGPQTAEGARISQFENDATDLASTESVLE